MDAFKFNEMAGLTGFFKPNGHKKKRRPYRRQIQGGVRIAVLRSFTAAQFLLRGEFSTVAQAARACGSTPSYVAASVVIIQSENTVIRSKVLFGQLSLLAAARQLCKAAKLIEAYRGASESDRAMFGCAIGPANLFDAAVSPAL